jgi:hypothetical protein
MRSEGPCGTTSPKTHVEDPGQLNGIEFSVASLRSHLVTSSPFAKVGLAAVNVVPSEIDGGSHQHS